MVIAAVNALLPVLLSLIDAVEARWGARDDPTWETRWRSLDPDERTWLAAMATQREWIATLTDPEEVRLAKGCRRRESGRRVKFDLAALPLLVAASALALAGLVDGGPVLLTLLFGFGLVRMIWIYRRERQIKGALEAQRQIAAGTAVPAV